MNANKDHRNEGNVFRNVVEQRVAGNAGVVGLMLESHLNPGSQKLGDDPTVLEHGVSITDPCIGWAETEEIITAAAAQLR